MRFLGRTNEMYNLSLPMKYTSWTDKWKYISNRQMKYTSWVDKLGAQMKYRTREIVM